MFTSRNPRANKDGTRVDVTQLDLSFAARRGRSIDSCYHSLGDPSSMPAPASFMATRYVLRFAPAVLYTRDNNSLGLHRGPIEARSTFARRAADGVCNNPSGIAQPSNRDNRVLLLFLTFDVERDPRRRRPGSRESSATGRFPARRDAKRTWTARCRMQEYLEGYRFLVIIVVIVVDPNATRNLCSYRRSRSRGPLSLFTFVSSPDRLALSDSRPIYRPRDAIDEEEVPRGEKRDVGATKCSAARGPDENSVTGNDGECLGHRSRLSIRTENSVATTGDDVARKLPAGIFPAPTMELSVWSRYYYYSSQAAENSAAPAERFSRARVKYLSC